MVLLIPGEGFSYCLSCCRELGIGLMINRPAHAEHSCIKTGWLGRIFPGLKDFCPVRNKFAVGAVIAEVKLLAPEEEGALGERINTDKQAREQM